MEDGKKRMAAPDRGRQTRCLPRRDGRSLDSRYGRDRASAPSQPQTLDDVMIAMDVVDTLRHREDLVRRELNEEGRESELIARLRQIYRDQGIEVPDHVAGGRGQGAKGQPLCLYAAAGELEAHLADAVGQARDDTASAWAWPWPV